MKGIILAIALAALLARPVGAQELEIDLTAVDDCLSAMQSDDDQNVATYCARAAEQAAEAAKRQTDRASRAVFIEGESSLLGAAAEGNRSIDEPKAERQLREAMRLLKTLPTSHARRARMQAFRDLLDDMTTESS